jgi:hypothetical protein
VRRWGLKIRRSGLLTTFNLDLRGIIRDDFRDAFVVAYLSGDADTIAAVRLLGIAELRTITAPNEHGEDLVRVGLIQIDEGRISATPCRVMRAHHLAADRCLLPDVLPGLSRRDRLLSLNLSAAYNRKRKQCQCPATVRVYPPLFEDYLGCTAKLNSGPDFLGRCGTSENGTFQHTNSQRGKKQVPSGLLGLGRQFGADVNVPA